MPDTTTNRPMVSIIIPFHNEGPTTLVHALSSIDTQIGIDFSQVEVILVGDGGQELPAGPLFPLLRNLTIKYRYFPDSQGAGVARQRGMGMARGQYYMFIDADDELSFDGALSQFFGVANAQAHEIIFANYIEEVRPNPTQPPAYRYDQPKWSACYAKWFNRDFVARKNIHWLDDVRIFEDVYFCSMAMELAKDVYRLDSYVYMWRFNPKSTVRDPQINFNHRLHEWARMNRHYLEKVHTDAPNLFLRDFGGSLATLYFWSKHYPPSDPVALDQEQAVLLHEYAQYWDQAQPFIKQRFDSMHAPGAEFASYDVSDWPAYLAHVKALMQQK